MHLRLLLLAPALALSTIASAEAPAPATTAAKPPPGGLTDATLEAKLTGLGYTPKKLKNGFLIEVKRGTWTLYVQVLLSPDLTKLGMNANMGVTDDASQTTQQLRDLLIANGDIDPSSFYLDATNHKLYLHRSIDNRGITPAILADQLNHFDDNVINTEATWKPLVH